MALTLRLPDRDALRRLGALGAVVAMAATLSAALPRPGVLDGLAEDAALALAHAAAPSQAEGVVVVAVDARSLAAPELRDLPRVLMGPVWATAATRSLQAGAVAVGLDFILAFDSAALILDGEPALKRWDDPLLRLLLREGRAGRVVIGASRDTAPAARIARVAGEAGIAFVDLPVDPDGVVRRVPTSLPRADGGAAPTLTGAMLRAAGVAQPPETIRLAAPRPVDALPTVSLIDLLRCDDAGALAALLDGRIVLMGSVMPGEDRHRSPDRFMAPPSGAPAGAPCAFARPQTRDAAPDTAPGVFLHAAAAAVALAGPSPRRGGPGPSAALAAIGALAGGAAALALNARWAAAATAAVCAAGLALAAAAVTQGHVAPVARLMMGAVAGAAALWALRAAFSDRRVRLLRESFGRYLAPHLVDQLLRQERPPALEGETREIAIMFADLSGFTALSARTDSAVLTEAVNRYLGVIAEAVEAGGGYVDKFIGDAVMALWNAPLDQPEPAVSALRVARAIADAVAAQAARDGAAGMPAFDVKIAVSAGPATVGNVGHRARMNYTAIGPAVNMAARLEALPGRYATPVVMDETAATQCAAAFEVMRIGYVALKGVPGPVGVFAPLFERAAPPSDADATLALAARYAQALAFWKAGDFAPAAALWGGLAARPWPGAGPAAAMAADARARPATEGPPAEAQPTPVTT